MIRSHAISLAKTTPEEAKYLQVHFIEHGTELMCHKLDSALTDLARRGLDKNIVSTTAPERAVLSVLSLGVALRTDESGASEAAETCIFLASI